MTQQVEQTKARILIIIGILFCLGIAVTLNRVPFIRAKSDIYLRWYATTKLLAENRNLYDERNGEEIQQLVYGDNPVFRTTNFYYPAHLLIFTAPLSLLSYPAAHLIWTTATQLFYLTGLWLLIKAVRWPDTINKTTLFLVAATLFIPNLQHIIWGQFNTISVLSLVVSYLALRRQRYGMAGIWAVGLTFKPQAALLPLAFLLLWSLWHRRWRLLLGFSLTIASLWAFAELFQPHWVIEFVASLSDYIPVQSGLDQIWNPYQVTAAGLMLATSVLFIRNRNMAADSVVFAGCLALSVSIWSLVVPIVGMMHTVILAPVSILVLAGLKRVEPRMYRSVLIALGLVYLGGFVGFIWGLSDQALYGKHIQWSEFAYKTALPTLMTLFALQLCLNGRNKTEKL